MEAEALVAEAKQQIMSEVDRAAALAEQKREEERQRKKEEMAKSRKFLGVESFGRASL